MIGTKVDMEISPQTEAALSAASCGVPPDARARLRLRVMRTVRADALLMRVRRATRAASAVLVALGVCAGSLQVAAAASLPGDALYGVKRTIEEARVAASTGGYRDLLLGVAADERAEELTGLVARGSSDQEVQIAAIEFEMAARRAFGGSGAKRLDSVRDAVKGKPATTSAKVEREAEKAHGVSTPAGSSGGKPGGEPNVDRDEPKTPASGSQGSKGSGTPDGSGSSSGSGESGGSGGNGQQQGPSGQGQGAHR